MAYETYPPQKMCDTWGTMLPGWKNGHGHRYPGKSLPSTKDDRDMSIISQHGCGCTAPGDTYPKGRVGHQKFGKLQGLP